jgi:hypothetical protein
MALPFTAKQYNWRFYEDDGAEPTNPLANENATPTLLNSNKIRLRVQPVETGRQTDGRNLWIEFQYSTDDANWNAPGAGAEWNYADGQATEGNTIAGFKLSLSNLAAQYVESEWTAGTFTHTAGKKAEWDICLVPTATVQPGIKYYFQLYYYNGWVNPILLGPGQTHPSVITAGFPHSFCVET